MIYRFLLLLFCGHLSLLLPSVAAADSTCYGTTGHGRLEQGVKLPASGNNFVSYSAMGPMLGRTYVHSSVDAVVVDSFAALEHSRPDTIYMIGETGRKNGGPFKPHKTHQNGLSVDFMVPVIDRHGNSVPLPTSPFNKFGYNIEFDREGTFDDLRIDYEALTAHLLALEESAREHGIGIWRVIFDPELQPQLFATSRGDELASRLTFSKKRSWVRHDEHYHVDFSIDCKPLTSD